MTAIFISHSSVDNAAAGEMKDWLEGKGHTSLFLDFDPEAGIRSGSDWEQTLYQKLRQCQAQGRWLVTGSDDTTARLWDLHAADPNQTVRVLRGHEKGITAVALDPQGRWLV